MRNFVRYALKQNKIVPNTAGLTAAQYTALRMREHLAGTELESFLDADAVLVPAPGHAKRGSESLWVPREFAAALAKVGFGRTVESCLERVETVKKSATAASVERPTAQQHVDSLSVEPLIESPSSITVVDDVITSGATLLASAAVLATAFPDVKIRAFAACRTMSDWTDVAEPIQPCVGDVSWDSRAQRTRRNP